MTDKSFKIPRGQAVRVRVELPAPPDSPPASTRTNQPQQPRALFFSDEETDETYAFRKESAVKFYDLATRLRSVPPETEFTGLRVRAYGSTESAAPDEDNVSEYIEAAFEAAGVFHNVIDRVDNPDGDFPYVTLSEEEWQRLNRILLGSLAPAAEGEPDDPLSPVAASAANGSARQMPHAMEIYYRLVRDQLALAGVTVYPANALVRETREFGEVYVGDLLRYIVSPQEKVFEGSDQDGWGKREPEESDDDERWNPLNVESGAAFDQLVIPKEAFKDKSGQLMLGSFQALTDGDETVYRFNEGDALYHGFDTGDTDHYKLTRTPSFDALEVTFSFKGKSNRVYLRPRAVAYHVTPEEPEPSDVPEGHAWVGRAPVYPQPGALSCLIRRSQFSDAEHLTADSHFEFVSIKQGADLILLPVGALVAVIAQGGRLTYVWRRTALPSSGVVSGVFQPVEECE